MYGVQPVTSIDGAGEGNGVGDGAGVGAAVGVGDGAAGPPTAVSRGGPRTKAPPMTTAMTAIAPTASLSVVDMLWNLHGTFRTCRRCAVTGMATPIARRV